MANTRANRIAKYLRETMPKVEQHVGHKVELRYPQGATGTIVRFSSEDGKIRAWITSGEKENEKFPAPFYIEELKACLTCDEKEKANGASN